MVPWKGIMKFVAHGKATQRLVVGTGWRHAARYTNLRDVRGLNFERHGFLDIDWKNYDFGKHVAAVEISRPLLTVARDIETICDLSSIIKEAEILIRYASFVIVVPKDPRMSDRIESAIPPQFILGYSVPTRYGGTRIPPEKFTRSVHLLGGRPDVQRKLGNHMHVVSLDCNRFTLDARYGDYFDGQIFRPHPEGGYEKCMIDSMRNIEKLWCGYEPLLSRRPSETG